MRFDPTHMVFFFRLLVCRLFVSTVNTPGCVADSGNNRAVAPEPTCETDALISWERLASVRTIREFDALVIVPMFGYPHISAYYDGFCLSALRANNQ